jgi:hypothetical protein
MVQRVLTCSKLGFFLHPPQVIWLCPSKIFNIKKYIIHLDSDFLFKCPILQPTLKYIYIYLFWEKNKIKANGFSNVGRVYISACMRMVYHPVMVYHLVYELVSKECLTSLVPITNLVGTWGNANIISTLY